MLLQLLARVPRVAWVPLRARDLLRDPRRERVLLRARVWDRWRVEGEDVTVWLWPWPWPSPPLLASVELACAPWPWRRGWPSPPLERSDRVTASKVTLSRAMANMMPMVPVAQTDTTPQHGKSWLRPLATHCECQSVCPRHMAPPLQRNVPTDDNT